MKNISQTAVVLLIILCVGFAVLSPIYAQEINPATLDEYLRYTALNSPALESSFQTWKSALEQVPQSQALNDPQFNFGYFIREVETKVGPQQSRIGITQAFPWFGKLSARGNIAMAKAENARMAYETVKVNLFSTAKVAWYEFAYMGKALELARDNFELMKYYEEIARSKYQGAQASHPDIVRAQIELASLQEVVTSLEALRQPQSARLVSIANLPEGTTFDWPVISQADIVMLDRQEIIDAVLSANPELRGMESLIAAGRGQIELAEKQAYPDFAIGVDWIQTGRADMSVPDSGKDPVVLMFSMNLPLWRDKTTAAKRQAVAGLRAVELKKLQMQNDKVALASELVYKIEDAHRKMILNQDTLGVKADELVKASEAAYRNGTLDFLSLIDAQRRRLKYKLDYYRSLTDYLERLAELDSLQGQIPLADLSRYESEKK